MAQSNGDDVGNLGQGPDDWPLWVDVGVPMLSIALFIAVNLCLYATHRPPEAQEDLPLAGMSSTNPGQRSVQAQDIARYGSTTKEPIDPDRLVPAENLALTISMEETSFNAAIQQEPLPGTSGNNQPAHAYMDMDYLACAGACASISTEPLVTSGLSQPERDKRQLP